MCFDRSNLLFSLLAAASLILWRPSPSPRTIAPATSPPPIAARFASFVSTPRRDRGIEVSRWIDRVLETANAVARVCVKEAGFRGFRDCPAIWAVLRRVGRGDALRGAMRYSPLSRARVRAPWLGELEFGGERPDEWPRGLSWSWRARDFDRLAYQVIELEQGEASPPCFPDHWGASSLDGRSLARGWRVVDCGPTVNRFWSMR